MCGNPQVALPSRAAAHYCRPMPVVRRLLAVCALALALALALAAPAAAATPQEIFEDYAFNRGAIVGDYAYEDLRAALEGAQGDVFYEGFARAVEEKLEVDNLGRTPSGGDGDLIGATQEGLGLPTPRTPDESGDPPWPFLALTILAGALVVSGAGSSLYRRSRR